MIGWKVDNLWYKSHICLFVCISIIFSENIFVWEYVIVQNCCCLYYGFELYMTAYFKSKLNSIKVFCLLGIPFDFNRFWCQFDHLCKCINSRKILEKLETITKNSLKGLTKYFSLVIQDSQKRYKFFFEYMKVFECLFICNQTRMTTSISSEAFKKKVKEWKIIQ